MSTTKLSIIGGGVMGEALLSRLIEQQIYDPAALLVSDPQADRRQYLASRYGVQVTSDNSLAAEHGDVLLLAVKPQMFVQVCQELRPPEKGAIPIGEQRVISILAGVPLAKLEAAFPGQPVIRAMPNTPATVGAGMTAIAAGTMVQPHHLVEARCLFAAVGEVVELPESLMDAVTGLSGSGPGYVAVMIEALTDGGVAAGLPRAIASRLAIQTVLGTAQMLQDNSLHPAELKDRVTSPGGTTIAGITALESGGVRAALIKAVLAARDRARELGG